MKVTEPRPRLAGISVRRFTGLVLGSFLVGGRRRPNRPAVLTGR